MKVFESTGRAPFGLALVAGLLFGFAGCVEVTDPSENPVVVHLRLQANEEPMHPGEEQALSVDIGWSDGRTESDPPGIAWSSSAPQVATVSDEGVVTAVAEGSVEITAALESLTAQVLISVVNEDGG